MSPFGEIVDGCWKAIPEHHSQVVLDQWVIMPDHVHGILVLERPCAFDEGRVGAPAEKRPRSGSLGAIIGTFKAAVTREVNVVRATPGAAFWQRNYFEHVIRDAHDLHRVRGYIASNPARWVRRHGPDGYDGASDVVGDRMDRGQVRKPG